MSEKTVKKSSALVLPYAWVILVIVYLASVVAPFNQFKVPPILPVLMDAFQIDLARAGLLMSTLALTGLALALPAGIILQRFGPRITALIALGSLAAGSTAGALSGSFSSLVISRVAEGIGMGLIGVAAPATIAMWFPPARQGTPMGIWATWVPVGTVVMYFLAPQLAGSTGWQSVWWVGTGFAIVMAVFSGLMLRRPPVATSASAAPAGHDLRQALANRDIWLLGLEFAFFNLVFVSFGTYYPTFLNEVRGYPLGQAALIASLGTSITLISAPLAGLFSDRIGSRRLVFSIPYLAIAVLFIFPFRVTGWLIPLVMVVQGMIAGAIPTATFTAAPEIMGRPQWAGFGLAVVQVGQNLGQLVGPVLFGQLVNQLGWVTAGYFLIPVCLLGFLCGWKVNVR
jgi:MFS family permease